MIQHKLIIQEPGVWFLTFVTMFHVPNLSTGRNGHLNSYRAPIGMA